jgi:hypothetical protein
VTRTFRASSVENCKGALFGQFMVLQEVLHFVRARLLVMLAATSLNGLGVIESRRVHAGNHLSQLNALLAVSPKTLVGWQLVIPDCGRELGGRNDDAGRRRITSIVCIFFFASLRLCSSDGCACILDAGVPAGPQQGFVDFLIRRRGKSFGRLNRGGRDLRSASAR